jgi:large subunit ribosomal protein L29
MKALNPKDLRDKSIEELDQVLKQEQAALFALRRDLALRQTSDRASLMTTRHNIARVKTVMTEKQKNEGAPAEAAAPKPAAKKKAKAEN